MAVVQRTYPLWGAATPANAVTFSRILMTPLLCSMVLADEATLGTSWAAFAVGLLMAFTDLIDGRVARATNSFSRSGAFLDPLADKIVILGVGFSLVAVDRVALVPMVLIAGRELIISAMRIRFAMRDISIPARPLAKWKATIQGAALLLAVMPALLDQQTVVDIAIWFAVAITLFTGAQYLRDGEAAARQA
ncbi:MAG: CDP-alcohol phosphatidyltransferase family protein [Actinomycetota bacterium]